MRSDFLDVFAKKGITVKNILSGMDSLNIIVHQSEIEDIEEELLSQIREKVALLKLKLLEFGDHRRSRSGSGNFSGYCCKGTGRSGQQEDQHKAHRSRLG